jgi:hypothetical protein
MWWFWVETWSKKGLIHYYAYTNIANRIVFSFVWRKFSSVGIREWWGELKNGQKLKLGDAHALGMQADARSDILGGQIRL